MYIVQTKVELDPSFGEEIRVEFKTNSQTSADGYRNFTAILTLKQAQELTRELITAIAKAK